jgi:WD40 repeat protein
MPDGDTVLFESNRNGNWDVFRQRLESFAAEPVAAGAGEQFGAQSAPGGAVVLYWSSTDGGSDMRLMSLPSAGGPSNVVLQAARNSEFRCASRASSKDSGCVLAEFDGQKMSVTGFDWSNGAKGTRQQLPVQVSPGERVIWALSPDGRSVAVNAGGEVRVMKLGASESWSVPASTFSGTISGVAFRDHTELVVTTASARESAVLLVSPRGARKLWTVPRQVSSPVVSGDGQHLLLGITTESSNAWLVEDF